MALTHSIYDIIINRDIKFGRAIFDINGSTGISGQILTATNSGVIWQPVGTASPAPGLQGALGPTVSVTPLISQIGFVINLPSAGATGTIDQTLIGVGYTGSITAWELTCYPTASVSVDVWKSSSVPTIANTILGSTNITTSSSKYNNGLSTGWTTSVSVGNFFMMAIRSNDLASQINLQLIVNKF
jgi:hypothetical protein